MVGRYIILWRQHNAKRERRQSEAIYRAAQSCTADQSIQYSFFYDIRTLPKFTSEENTGRRPVFCGIFN